jgi:hypothetical protein
MPLRALSGSMGGFAVVEEHRTPLHVTVVAR